MTTRKQTDETIIAVMGGKVDRIQTDVAEIKNSMQHNYVTIEAFEPVRKIVYGLVTLILIGVVGALLALVIKK